MNKLIRKALLLLALLAFSSPAFAQAWTVGEQTVSYSFPPVIGDGSTSNGGTPPYFTSGNEPAEINAAGNYTLSQWYVNNSIDRIDNGEAKVRFTCNFAKFGSLDPMLAYGLGTLFWHHHTFYGGFNVTSTTDYASLRNSPKSSCAGGPTNPTAYWEPSLMRLLSSGARAAYKPNNLSIYYTHGITEGPTRQRLPRNLGFITGADPMDFNDTRIRAELLAAGLQYQGGYTSAVTGWSGLGNNGTPAGHAGWSCMKNGNKMAVDPPHGGRDPADTQYGTTDARYLVGPFGEDPWGGRCEPSTGSDVMLLYSTLYAPTCWDGINARSAGARRHMRQTARKGDNSYNDVCPTGWYKLPRFEAKVEYSHKGWANDLRYRFLSSDHMRMASTECPDATQPCNGVSGGNTPATVSGVFYSRVSNDPCRARTIDFCPGATLHADWLGAWDQDVMDTWMERCLGMDVAGSSLTVEHKTCGNATIDSDKRLLVLEASPGGSTTLSNNPVITLTPIDQNTNAKYAPIEAGQTGPFTIHGHKP